MQEIKIHYPGTTLLLLCNAKVILGYLTLLHTATLFLLHISLCVYVMIPKRNYIICTST